MSEFENKISAVKLYLLQLQNSLCQTLSAEDGQADFQEDIWEHSSGGGGITRVISQGRVFEKGAVNFSHIMGNRLPPAASQRNPHLGGNPFQALGVSLILHPLNPHTPTVHLNVRFFIADTQGQAEVWWFGGGFDLTPFYGYMEDCIHWHTNARSACTPFGDDIYPRFKRACDEYFFLPHRQEPRGIGGLMFDDYTQGGFERAFALMRSVGDHFIPGYLPIAQRRQNTPYSSHEREFQNYRRGRYVEFNLLYDRGTLFGLQSGGRAESILVSLPPQTGWRYQWQPSPGSREAELYQKYLVIKDWL